MFVGVGIWTCDGTLVFEGACIGSAGTVVAFVGIGSSAGLVEFEGVCTTGARVVTFAARGSVGTGICVGANVTGVVTLVTGTRVGVGVCSADSGVAACV